MKNLRSYSTILVLFALCFATSLHAKNRKNKPPSRKQPASNNTQVVKPVRDRRSSAPFITGDGFRNACDFIIEEDNAPFNPKNVKYGDKVFVKTDFLPHFLQHYHPRIPVPYVLVTHNSDHRIPGPYAGYLNDEKILGWFGQNVEEVAHPKLHPIPIGLENRYNKNGDPEILKQCIEKFQNSERTNLLYMNFSPHTAVERVYVYKLFEKAPFCKASAGIPYADYLQDLATTQFTLSPRGNGLDCHRTWEALYFGSIPIVRTSVSDSMYEGLPVVIIQDWSEVTEAFLEKEYQKIRAQPHPSNRLYLDYWLQQIEKARNLGDRENQ